MNKKKPTQYIDGNLIHIPFTRDYFFHSRMIALEPTTTGMNSIRNT